VPISFAHGLPPTPRVIFRPELARKINAGQKTMTRRPINGAPLCRYQPGKSYAVQPGRGQSATCRIKIVAVRRELAGDIAFHDARAEGFPTTEEFKAYWVSIHDKVWLEHENKMLDEAENDDGVVLDRDVWLLRRSLAMFEQRHAHKPVWVISFHLDLAPVGRLLALRSHEGYTTNPARALPHEPEAVDPDTQKRITRDAGMTTRQWQALEATHRDRDRELLSREDQLVRLQRSARLRGVDVSRETWALQNMLKTASEDSFARKVQKTEARVFQAAA
jgi:hypothetical protein